MAARRAILTKLRADTTLAALVASIDPDGEPTWPFVLVESPRTLRIRAACVRGATVNFDLHAFAGPREVGGAQVETGYDHVSRIASVIEALFCESQIVLESGTKCAVRLSDAQYLKDGEPDHWHWFSQLNCRVLSE